MFTLKRHHKTLNEVLANNDSEAVDIVKDLFRSIDKMNTATEIINRTCAYETALYGYTNRAKVETFVYSMMGIN